MSGWISVSERLPSRGMDGVAVVVAIKTRRGDVVSETDAWVGEKFDFWGGAVTHWQPLPEPPK
jgi:hypothetical protein